MKKFLVFTILLLSNSTVSWACGYSPFGEDIRFCLYHPSYFNYSQFQSFDYNANLWSYNYSPDTEHESNVTDWYNYTHKKVAIESINEFLNNLKFTDINKESSNEFIQYLYKIRDVSAIQYLTIAKKCEDLNNRVFEDPWERKDGTINRSSEKIVAELQAMLLKEKNPEFKRKYAFQFIRIAYYAGNLNLVKSCFDNYFDNSNKDYLSYWSLYFYCFTDPVDKELKIAEIFSNSKEKAYATYYYFHDEFDFNKAFAKAKTDTEKAQVYAYISVQKIDKNLEYLKEIYNYKSNYDLLDFLLLREINKLEDWIYTPYYTNYLPSTEFSNYWDRDDKVTTETLRLRSENDRLYAKEVLDFVETVNLAKVKNKALWLSAKIQLQFMTKDYDNCFSSITVFENQFKNEKVSEEVAKIKALCLTARQENGKAVILPEIEATIFKYQDDNRFIFALGRELEFRGNLVDGIALISFLEIRGRRQYYYEYGGVDNSVEWCGNRIKDSGNLPYFYTYFDYLDFVYSAKDLQTVVNQISNSSKSPFYETIYGSLVRDKDNLIDLLGTKYLRENNLNASSKTFKLLNDDYWSGFYNGWERGSYDDYYAFYKNPFYSFKYTNEFIDHKDKFLVNKKSVLNHIIKYANLANNPKNPDRDYYYFLLGNCYYNMSQYGHSWMLRRYNSTSDYYTNENEMKESYFDEVEYRKNKIALHYYQLAYKTAKTDKFKALCLRMMDYTEKQNFSTSSRVKEVFPEYENDLSGCDNLEEYFKARR